MKAKVVGRFAALALCVGASAAAAKDTQLNIYNWSDYIAKDTIPNFEKQTGVKVRYDNYDSDDTLQAKLLTGSSGYDIVVPTSNYAGKQIAAGIFTPLDKSKLPNLKNLDPGITERLATFDPGNEYAVNYMWGTSGVAYNEEAIKAAMPDAPVDSFKMFWDPKVVSKFEKCGVSVLDAPSEVIGTVLIYLGKNANSEDPKDLAAAEKVLMSVRPYIRNIHSSAYIEQLAGGEICLALGWSGDALQAKGRAEESKKPFTIKYNIPKEGAVMFFDNMAIPADASHVKNAHLFIDYMLRPEVAAKNSNFLSYANSNAASWPLITPEVKNNPSVFPTADVMPKLVPDLPESPEFTRALTRTWTRFRTGK